MIKERHVFDISDLSIEEIDVFKDSRKYKCIYTQIIKSAVIANLIMDKLVENR